MNRPTPEEIAADRALLAEPIEQWNRNGRTGLPVLTQYDMQALERLLAATAPPTDEEIADAYVENVIPRGSERMAIRRADRVRDVALTIREPVAATWPDEVHAARTVRHFLGPVKP